MAHFTNEEKGRYFAVSPLTLKYSRAASQPRDVLCEIANPISAQWVNSSGLNIRLISSNPLQNSLLKSEGNPASWLFILSMEGEFKLGFLFGKSFINVNKKLF